MVTVMAANNEIGTIQPIADISRAIKKSSRSLMVFHTDAVQAVGHIPVDVQKMLALFVAAAIVEPEEVGSGEKVSRKKV